MSELTGSNFVHIPSAAEQFRGLGLEQRLAQILFSLTYCTDHPSEPITHLDNRPGEFPMHVGHFRAINDGTVYSLNTVHNAYEDPDDHLLLAAQVRDNVLRIEELEVLQIGYIKAGLHGIDKIIGAKWHETSKKVTLRLGHQVAIMTQDQDGRISYSPGLFDV